MEHLPISINKTGKLIGITRVFLGIVFAPILANLSLGVVFYVFYGSIDELVVGTFILIGVSVSLPFSLVIGMPTYFYLVQKNRVGLLTYVSVAAVIGLSLAALFAGDGENEVGLSATLGFLLGAFWGLYFWLFSLWRNKSYYVPRENKLTNFRRPTPNIGF